MTPSPAMLLRPGAEVVAATAMAAGALEVVFVQPCAAGLNFRSRSIAPTVEIPISTVEIPISPV